MERFGERPKKKSSKWDLSTLSTDVAAPGDLSRRHGLPETSPSSAPSPPTSPLRSLTSSASGEYNIIELPCGVFHLGFLKVLAAMAVLAVVLNFFSVTFYEAHFLLGKSSFSTRASRSTRETSGSRSDAQGEALGNPTYHPLGNAASQHFPLTLTPPAAQAGLWRPSSWQQQSATTAADRAPTTPGEVLSLTGPSLRGGHWGGGANKQMESQESSPALSYASQHPFTLDPAGLRLLKEQSAQLKAPPPPCRQAPQKVPVQRDSASLVQLSTSSLQTSTSASLPGTQVAQALAAESQTSDSSTSGEATRQRVLEQSTQGNTGQNSPASTTSAAVKQEEELPLCPPAASS